MQSELCLWCWSGFILNMRTSFIYQKLSNPFSIFAPIIKGSLKLLTTKPFSFKTILHACNIVDLVQSFSTISFFLLYKLVSFFIIYFHFPDPHSCFCVALLESRTGHFCSPPTSLVLPQKLFLIEPGLLSHSWFRSPGFSSEKTEVVQFIGCNSLIFFGSYF